LNAAEDTGLIKALKEKARQLYRDAWERTDKGGQ
jgi:hypothetical protein